MTQVIKIALILLFILLLAWFIICDRICKKWNNVRKISDTLSLMFDTRYRMLTILRQTFLKECGENGSHEDYLKWKNNVDIEELSHFSYQLRFMLSNLFKANSSITNSQD